MRLFDHIAQQSADIIAISVKKKKIIKKTGSYDSHLKMKLIKSTEHKNNRHDFKVMVFGSFILSSWRS